MKIQMEIVRDRYPDSRNGVYIWIDDAADRYQQWAAMGDPDEKIDKPQSTVMLSSEKVDQIVAGWLRGPEGPCGPMGATGASGA